MLPNSPYREQAMGAVVPHNGSTPAAEEEIVRGGMSPARRNKDAERISGIPQQMDALPS